jgi:hypothetical protein
MDRKIIRYRRSGTPLSGGEVTCPGEDVAQIVFTLALAFDRLDVLNLSDICQVPPDDRQQEQPVAKIDPEKAKKCGCDNGLT